VYTSFDPEDLEAPYLLRTEHLVTAGMITAALYCNTSLLDIDLAADDDMVWRHAAIEITQRGTSGTSDRARLIRLAEDEGTLARPAWLAACRARTAALIGPAWLAAPCRCPCGYATFDPAELTEHLDPSRRTRPGHYAADATRTLAQHWETARPAE
jgi:hypothetical protein